MEPLYLGSRSQSISTSRASRGSESPVTTPLPPYWNGRTDVSMVPVVPAPTAAPTNVDAASVAPPLMNGSTN